VLSHAGQRPAASNVMARRGSQTPVSWPEPACHRRTRGSALRPLRAAKAQGSKGASCPVFGIKTPAEGFENTRCLALLLKGGLPGLSDPRVWGKASVLSKDPRVRDPLRAAQRLKGGLPGPPVPAPRCRQDARIWADPRARGGAGVYSKDPPGALLHQKLTQ